MIAPNFDEYIPWIEKYRPKEISDVIDQNHITKFLKSSAIKKNVKFNFLWFARYRKHLLF